eukprot:UN13906
MILLGFDGWVSTEEIDNKFINYEEVCIHDTNKLLHIPQSTDDDCFQEMKIEP